MQLKNDFIIRQAVQADLPAIVRLLADDLLGQQREHYSLPLSQNYQNAFDQITTDANNELIVLENSAHAIIGTMQLTFIASLTFEGSRRLSIEAVRVDSQHRSKGLGRMLFAWAIARAREKDCKIVQLTTNQKRAEAVRFYQSLGFEASHIGMKMQLR